MSATPRRGKWGRQLEDAVGAGCKRYRVEGKADIFKREVRMQKRDGQWFHAQRAGADYSGLIAGGGSFAAECKESHRDAFNIFDEKAGLKDHQRAALERAAKLGALSGLIMGYMHRPPWEIYFVPIVELVLFLDAPWRQSLTPDMCRAWGVALPIGASPSGKPLVRFLDGDVHPDKNGAITRVNAEKLAAQSQPSLFADDGVRPYEEPPSKPSRFGEGKLDPFDPKALRAFAKRKGLKTGMWGK